jgi:glycosyltransferase involved in cell wall biosynthesis
VTDPADRSLSSMHVAALVPAFNEADTIAAVVSGARAHVAAVVVVDDGSTDGTASLAREAGADVVSHRLNRGKGHAVRTGLAHVLDGPFTHVLLMDGDLQHRPDDIPKLVEAARTRDLDLVVGARVFDRARMPRARYYSNVIGSRALSSFVGSAVRDTQSGFRLVRCELLRDLRLTSTGYEIETEMLIRLARRGARIGHVDVTLAYQGARSKLRPVRDTTRTCFLAVYYRFLCRR